jgi:hypothetical protein
MTGHCTVPPTTCPKVTWSKPFICVKAFHGSVAVRMSIASCIDIFRCHKYLQHRQTLQRVKVNSSHSCTATPATKDKVSSTNTCKEDFVHEPVGLVEVEHQIQLAHVAEVLIQHLHELMNHIQCHQLVIIIIYCCHKVEACIPLVHNFEVPPIDEVAQLREKVRNRHTDLVVTALEVSEETLAALLPFQISAV